MSAHDFPSKPGVPAVCTKCGVELRLVTVKSGKHSRSEVEYKAPNEGLWQLERIPCRRKT